MTSERLGLFLALVLATAGGVRAEVPAEQPGRVERFGPPFHAHWAGVSDVLLERIAFVDLDSGRFLGLINGGYGAVAPLFPSRRPEIYLPATYYARRTRGERTDVLEVYDAATLSPVDEIRLPRERAIDAVPLGHAALSDDDRFVAIFNWTPVPSLSIVDVERRVSNGEITIPGCSLVYAAGKRRFLALCGDGSVLAVTVDDTGRESGKQRIEPFFDPGLDPVTEKAVRYRDQWLFVSFEGNVHPVDVAGEQVRFGETWPLLSEADRDASWRVGGLQHLAVHEASGRFFSLMHRGGVDTHKEPGEEIWVYDLETRARVQRIGLRSPGIAIYGFPIEFGRRWVWPFNHLSEWLIDSFAPAAVSHIQVTQDDEPLLFTVSQFSGSIGTYDARSGAFLRRLQPVGWTNDLLVAPWGSRRAG